MRPGKVIDRLLRFGPTILDRWARDTPKCILASAFAIDVLERFDLAAAPLAVDVWGFNPAAWELTRDRNYDEATWRRYDAFVISTIGGELPEASIIEGPVWQGHLIAQVPALALVIDLELHRIARPARHLPLPASGAFAWPRGTTIRDYPIGDCRLRYRASGDTAWALSKDWTMRTHRRHVVDELARAIRAGHIR